MKTFDLNAYGVSELTNAETLSIDGGNAWVVIRLICEAIGIAVLVNEAANGFIDGFKAAWADA
jgi:hypothetical protein